MKNCILILFGLFSCSLASPYRSVPVPLVSVGVSQSNDYPTGRITNGEPAAEDQFPYQVGLSLQKSATSSSWCGGSLIGANWVLTAAHCTTGAMRVTVYLGSTVRTSPKVSYTVEAENIYQHSGYNAQYLWNDISLIKIPSVAFSSSIQPVRLPALSSSYSTYAGDYAIASGWGRTSDASSVAADLNFVLFQVMSNTVCAGTYGNEVITSNTICVNTPEGKSTCQGDSGGPLVAVNQGHLIGVTSFVSSAGCQSGAPAGFVRVTSYLDWIKANTGIAYRPWYQCSVSDIMKLFVILALAVAAASAGTILPERNYIHPRQLPVVVSGEGRITDGEDAHEGQFPYQVGLSFSSSSGGWWCGGSVIDNNWVLTAAHCTSGASSATVYLGATVRTSPKVQYTVSSSNFIQHASYNSLVLRNDISLIKIPSVTFTTYIQKVRLPDMASSYSTYAGQNAVASGWGLTSDSATAVASKLQYAVMQVIDNSVCSNTYGSLTITSKTICTATPKGTSTCSGDSGGPLVLQNDNRLIGVTSFVSSAGCQSGAPAGFVRVTSYLDWIKEHTGISY
ncbi:transmembrane protease serine 9-like [Haematobia irritans]|uniref:transmembrane protease serine 9-like n=1 Tax=Haematobia irritans TaxID=7368 RepID=UPI003F4FEAD3